MLLHSQNIVLDHIEKFLEAIEGKSYFGTTLKGKQPKVVSDHFSLEISQKIQKMKNAFCILKSVSNIIRT